MRMRFACKKRQVRLGAGLALAVLAVSPVSSTAATFTVNAPDDVDDGICSVAHCSLREAILAANANPGLDLIAFNIPGVGPHTIQPTFELPTITDPVSIDGYTQPGASPNTNPPYMGTNATLRIEIDGSNAGSNASGLHIVSGDSEVRGLAINRFTGGDSYASGSGIQLEANGGTVIQGNFIGTDITGMIARPNLRGVAAQSAENLIGGEIPSARNILSGNRFDGVILAHPSSQANVVQGNLIGTDATGTTAVPNEREGIFIQGGTNNSIGGPSLEERNIISGNGQDGIVMLGTSDGNRIQGNVIGADVSSEAPLSNGRWGIGIDSNFNIVGGSVREAGNVVVHNVEAGVVIPVGEDNIVQHNTIAFNGGNFGPSGNAGVTIGQNGFGNFAYRNRIVSNSMYSNVGLGIDLGANGVTPNDPNDADSGSNIQQNFPVLEEVVAETMVAITGTLNSVPNTRFMLEFFTNNECDPSGHGEGEVPIGMYGVTTDASGDASFTAMFPRPTMIGSFATATATDPDDNTSEFSACEPIEVISPVLPIVIDVKPGNAANVINPRSRGRFWVAIVSTDDFDALRVDPASVRIGAGGASPDKYRVRDSNYDGVADLLVRFRTPSVGIVCGDTSLELTGQTYDGVEIVGEDDLRTVGCKEPKPKKKGKKK